MRKKSVLKNVIAKWIGTILLTILQFISRRICVDSFGDKLLGLNGLLQSFISMLSLLELGVGSAIYYSLYEPLAKGDTQKISAIMQLYKKIYKYIGIVIMAVGVCILPFINCFISTQINLTTIRCAYLILLSDTVLSYFLSYSRNIFNADQKEFFCTNTDTVFGLITVLCQIVVTLVTGNFYLYLLIKVIGTLLANFVIFYYSKNKYHYLDNKVKYTDLSKEFLDTLKKNIKALCMSNIASYLVFGTDNVLLSGFVGLGSVFIYTNYNTIINLINQLFHNVFDSMRASIGNYMITETKNKTYELFERIYFLNYVVTCYTTVSMFTCFNDAITIWLGKQYIWSIEIVAILVLNNYMRHIQKASAVFRNAAGIYAPYPMYKFMPLIEGMINLIASVMLIEFFPGHKVLGVFLGTMISTVFFTGCGIHALYRYYFVEKTIRAYFAKYTEYFIVTVIFTILSSVLSKYLINCLNIESMLVVLIIDFAVALFVSFGGIVLIFRKNQNFIFYKTMILKKLVECKKENNN